MSWVKVILWNIILTVSLAEVTLRYLYTPISLKNRIEFNAQENEYDPRTIFLHSQMRYEPYSVTKMYHSEFSIDTSYDSLGFRNPCPFPHNSNGYNIIVGDSFVYGVGLADEQTFSCLLVEDGLKYYTIGIPGSDVPKYVDALKLNITRIRSVMSEPNSVYFVLFLGNDFESLVDFGSFVVSEHPEADISQSSIFNEILISVNRFFSKTSLINQSYLFSAIKLLLKSATNYSDKGEYIVTYGNSTFYKTTSRPPISEIAHSLSKIKSELETKDLNFDGLILIEDPAAISIDRLTRDLSIAGNFPVSLIDAEFKTLSVLQACEIENIPCFDTRSLLKLTDYYTFDNHLNSTGARKIADFIRSTIDGEGD